MSQIAAWLWLGGGAIAALNAILPDLPDADSVGLLTIAAIAAGTAATLLLAGDRVPTWAFHALASQATILVTLAIHFNGGPGAINGEFFYLWTILYVAYFFGREAIALQLLFAGLAYGALLTASQPGPIAAVQWPLTVGVLAGVAVVTRVLRERVDFDLSLHRATIESTTDGLLVVDNDGRWISFNRRFLDMWRIPDRIAASGDDDAALEYVLGQLADPGSFLAKVRDLYKEPEAESFDVLEFKDDRVFERYSQPQRVVGHSTVGRVWSFRDVTETKRIEKRLRHLAERDALTDIFNRRRLEQEIEREVARAARYGGGGAVLLLDLDHFKVVNDGRGHSVGDQLLRSVANLLRIRLRETDTVARLGGDEFAILLPRASAGEARAIAEQLLEAIRGHSLGTADGEVAITTSIGLACFGEERPTVDELLSAADASLYEAKRAGRDRIRVHDEAEPIAGGT